MLIWNDNYDPKAKSHGGTRSPLTVAISDNEGHSWKIKRNLETETDHGYSYISLIFYQGRAIMGYYVSDPSRKISSRFRSIPLAWFYEETAD